MRPCAAAGVIAPAFVSNPWISMSDRPAVVTRFAPSPTGYLHIGGARTALFNWLFARHCGGKFLLRVEDTDRERSTEAAVAAIFEGLDWLGLKADAEPVFQFARAERHREAVMDLVAKGRAYRCYMTPEEADAQREQARAEGRALRSPWRDQVAAVGLKTVSAQVKSLGLKLSGYCRGGMFTATALGIFFVPSFFVVIRQIFGGARPKDQLSSR